MDTGPLTFKPVDLNSHEELCIRFTEDTFIESFGDAKLFHEDDGKGSDRYRNWLRIQLSTGSTLSFLVWNESKVIGQITLGKWKTDPKVGYVYLYYLIPEMRGKGLAKILDSYSLDLLKNWGLNKALLTVSLTNKKALRFYLNNGWQDIGPRPDVAGVHFMQKNF
jgi:GNAT superfamily N-acetyltransferase